MAAAQDARAQMEPARAAEVVSLALEVARRARTCVSCGVHAPWSTVVLYCQHPLCLVCLCRLFEVRLRNVENYAVRHHSNTGRFWWFPAAEPPVFGPPALCPCCRAVISPGAIFMLGHGRQQLELLRRLEPLAARPPGAFESPGVAPTVRWAHLDMDCCVVCGDEPLSPPGDLVVSLGDGERSVDAVRAFGVVKTLAEGGPPYTFNFFNLQTPPPRPSAALFGPLPEDWAEPLEERQREEEEAPPLVGPLARALSAALAELAAAHTCPVCLMYAPHETVRLCCQHAICTGCLANVVQDRRRRVRRYGRHTCNIMGRYMWFPQWEPREFGPAVCCPLCRQCVLPGTIFRVGLEPWLEEVLPVLAEALGGQEGARVQAQCCRVLPPAAADPRVRWLSLRYDYSIGRWAGPPQVPHHMLVSYVWSQPRQGAEQPRL